MRIMATCYSRTGSASKVREDLDTVLALKAAMGDSAKAAKAYSRILQGETVKVSYQGSKVYFRKVG
jgi:hypothetical protein